MIVFINEQVSFWDQTAFLIEIQYEFPPAILFPEHQLLLSEYPVSTFFTVGQISHCKCLQSLKEEADALTVLKVEML